MDSCKEMTIFFASQGGVEGGREEVGFTVSTAESFAYYFVLVGRFQPREKVCVCAEERLR